MSQENVEIVRRATEAFQSGMERGDPGASWDLGTTADDLEWITTDPFEGKSVWRGREGYVEFIRLLTEQFDGWSMRIVRLMDAGDDRVVQLAPQSATGKESGIPVEMDYGSVYELKDGRIVRITSYPSHAEALEAAGLSE
jgi:ketosteroid isomerase-like protein